MRPFGFGSTTVMKVRWNDGNLITEVDLPMLATGQRIVIEHGAGSAGVATIPSTRLVPPPPTIGDKALVEISRLLRGGLRRSDRAFRVGGDEFAVLMPGTQGDEAHTVARRILSSCLEPRRDSGFERGFSFSAGIAAAPEMGVSRVDLYTKADLALYQ